MPSWENTPAKERRCVLCDGPFLAKRDSAKYCSPLCASRARPKRAYDPDVRRRNYRKRIADPATKTRYNQVANERARAVKAWISDFKIAAGCIDCGYNAHPAALDIDHMEGKTANISSLKSIAAVEAEIARHKCVVRCANCHRIKSWETRTWERHDSPSTAS